MGHRRELREFVEWLETRLEQRSGAEVDVRIRDFNHRGDAEGDARIVVAADAEDQASVQAALNNIEDRLDAGEPGEDEFITFDDQFPGSPDRIQDVFRVDFDPTQPFVFPGGGSDEGFDLTDIPAAPAII